MSRLISLIVLFTSFASASAEFRLGGFTETVFIVSDINRAQAFYEQVAGWEVRSDTAPDKSLKTLWKLDQQAVIKQRLMANKGENKGFVRLIEISGIEQQTIRMHSQAWDTGGIFDVNVRVLDMDKTYRALEPHGWSGDTPPLQFTFGPFEVKEWIVRGPDGVAFALIERLKPELEGWPNLKKFSRVFNSTQVVKDIQISHAFYRDVLGFQTYLEYRGASKGSGENVLGLPQNVAKKVERSVLILHPDKINEGSVELLQFHGADGRDVSHLASPPNLGVVTVRFPVDDLEGLKKQLNKHAVKIESETQMNLSPYGSVKVLAARSPDNTWLEFYQIVASN